jgi:hypothetical protein
MSKMMKNVKDEIRQPTVAADREELVWDPLDPLPKDGTIGKTSNN